MVSSEVFSPRIISTSGMRCTGLKKCIPQKRSGLSRLFASWLIEIVEVFEQIIASSATFSSTSLSTIPFTFGFSTTASITRSASLSVLYSRVGVIALSVCAILVASTLPRFIPLPSIFAASERPRSSAL